MKPVKQSKVVHASKYKSTRRGHDNRILNSLRLNKIALIASLVRLLRTPFTSAMAVTVMVIAISLAGSFYVLVSNAQQLVAALQTGKQISLFLEDKISNQQASRLAQEIRLNEAVDKVTLISKQQALAEFKQYSGFGAALDALESNPLPVVLQVYPKESLTEAAQLTILLTQMKSQQGVDFAQIDMEWVMRLDSIMQVVSRIVVLLSVLLALAVVFITGNTIRAELQARHDEVVITKLVGGTNTFIFLPFLYTGFWYGFISGALAWCVISLMFIMINAPIERLSLLYQSQFQMHFMSAGESALLLLASAALGVIGACSVASYQLGLLKPK